ncbi:hypothetical protein HII31_03694 [Pseudocercospora fuligena]|uniref:Uncharacterized protein n=1 Tax=Pseudocercospora fuligena TaxID=685502 RepID=A0A8H6VQC1_9PEZI|nr:hypothetical protein HII31_03694 [Pseudocercospora fuligena]
MIFDLSFVRDRSLDDLKYANGRKQHLNTPLDRPPRRIPKVRRRPTQLAVSRDWYILALGSWLRIGTLIVSATTIHNLRESSAKLRSKIISVKLRIDKDGLDNYARTQHSLAQMDTQAARRSMARKFTKEVLDLCPNLKRLQLTRMEFTHFLENLDPYGIGPVDRAAWITAVHDESWTTIFVGHQNLQHLALSSRPSRGWGGDMYDYYSRSTITYINVRLKCRGILIDDHKAVAKAIGYDHSVSYGHKEYESALQMLRSLHACKYMYEPGQPGWHFFDAAWDWIYQNDLG